MTSWNVRAIWENYSAWFHHRSTIELHATPPVSVAPTSSPRPAPALVAAADAHLAGGRPVEALHLTDLVLAVEPEQAAARRPQAATRQLLAQSSNCWEAAWLRRALEKLGGTT